jgi:hypothetical protein
MLQVDFKICSDGARSWWIRLPSMRRGRCRWPRRCRKGRRRRKKLNRGRNGRRRWACFLGHDKALEIHYWIQFLTEDTGAFPMIQLSICAPDWSLPSDNSPVDVAGVKE